MRRVIVTTAGTSLLTSWERQYSGQPYDKEKLSSALREQALNCAEIASLSKLDLDKQYDYLYLVTSDTEAGILCQEVIAGYLAEQGYPYTESVVIKGLSKNYHDFQTRGLPNLFEMLTEVKEKYGSARMVINATGGFKAQTSYATFFGIMSGVEVVYMHEDFSNMLTFPPMPVASDSGFILRHKERFAEITGASSRKEARRLIDELPVELRGFFKKADERYVYSPIGRFFISSLESRDETKSYTIRTFKNHSSLWGDGIQELERIKDSEVRALFRKIFDTAPYVTAIFLDEFMPVGKREEVFMEYVETFPQALRYLVHTPDGAEYVKVEVLPGMERETLRLLGRKIFS